MERISLLLTDWNGNELAMQVLQWNIDRDLRKEAETREVFERHLA